MSVYVLKSCLFIGIYIMWCGELNVSFISFVTLQFIKSILCADQLSLPILVGVHERVRCRTVGMMDGKNWDSPVLKVRTNGSNERFGLNLTHPKRIHYFKKEIPVCI